MSDENDNVIRGPWGPRVLEAPEFETEWHSGDPNPSPQFKRTAEAVQRIEREHGQALAQASTAWLIVSVALPWWSPSRWLARWHARACKLEASGFERRRYERAE